MNSKKLALLTTTLAFLAMSNANAAVDANGYDVAKSDGFRDTPIVPGTQWHVHDPDRPRPPLVKTEGAIKTPPPQDAIILLAVKNPNFSAWKALGKGTPWRFENGDMIVTDNDIETKESFGDCQVHLEWMAPVDSKERNGQGDMNSGIYFLKKYEVQILNTIGNTTYADGMAGAIYGQTPPLANAGVPKGNWNSYDIFFTGPRWKDGKLVRKARVTVIQNGVVLQNATEYMGPTEWKRVGQYSPNDPIKAPLHLQNHGDPVHFRNIWVRPIPPRTDLLEPEI